MSKALVRILAMALKELAVVLRDRRVLTTLVASPVIQLLLFGFATTLEVKNVSLGLVIWPMLLFAVVSLVLAFGLLRRRTN